MPHVSSGRLCRVTGESSAERRKTMVDHRDNLIDLNALFHPASVYDHPRDAVGNAALSVAEKRAILASWASDAAAVASQPALRELPGSHRKVSIDEVFDALAALDHRPKGPPGGKPARTKSTSRVGLAA
jgi:hypothetical protein